jgi:hypothetical protein
MDMGGLSLMGIIVWIAWGFFMGSGWWLANRVWSKVFG